MKSLWTNPGAKIKTLAKIFAYISFIISLILGFITITLGFVNISKAFAYGFEDFSALLLIQPLGGVVVTIVGIFFTWMFYLFVYAFGELVEKNSTISEQSEYASKQLYNLILFLTSKPKEQINTQNNQSEGSPVSSAIRNNILNP